MSTIQQLSYAADEEGGNRSNASSISFGMSYGAADPSADPALWCHPSATPETVVVPSQISSFTSVQAHYIPPQHGNFYNYAAQDVYQHVRSYHQQSGLTTSCGGISNTYHTQQDIPLDLPCNPHVHTNATISASAETRLAPGQDVSSLGLASLSKTDSQHYASSQLQYTNAPASVQHFTRPLGRSATMPYPSFPSSAGSISTYHHRTVPPPHFAAQNSAIAGQILERGHSFPSPGYVIESQHLGIYPQIDSLGQPTKPHHYRQSHHSHSPYASPPSISPSLSFKSFPEASPLLPATTHTEAATSRSGSSRSSSSAASSPSSTAPNLQATPPPSSASTLPPSDSQRFACRLCRGERTFSRTKDLERHIQSIHNRDPEAPRWICCGVPLSEADRWALPEWVRREPPYMLNGVPMVGGCKEQCSRKDVLKRHLRKNESRCFGSETAPWLPGNQLHKRPPRGGGNGAGVGYGSTGVERT